MSAQAALPGAYLNWSESSESLAQFLRYSVYRRLAGDTGDGTRIATITDRGLTTYTDYTIGSAVGYEYSVTQTIDNGVDEIEGEFVDWASVTIEVHSVFIHSHQHPEIYGEFEVEGYSDSREQDISENQVFRRTAPTSFIGPRNQGIASIPWRESWFEGSEEWDAVIDLMAAQADGDMLVLRQHRGIRMFGMLHSPGRSHAQVLYEGSLTFRENHFTEQV
jgi:hypothetical protein